MLTNDHLLILYCILPRLSISYEVYGNSQYGKEVVE